MLANVERIKSRDFVSVKSYKQTEIQNADQERLITEFYTSSDYRSRLTVLDKLLHHQGNFKLSEKFIIDVLNDNCAHVRQYMLENFDFQKISKVIEHTLTHLARNDEKVVIRMMAINTLAAINPTAHIDLFFNCALLKNNKESAAGLRGIHKIDPKKAYHMALFRINSSSGELDLAITEVLIEKGSAQDLSACKRFIAARKKFFKNRYIPIYLQFLSKFNDVELTQHHLEYICNCIQAEHNHTMTTMLVQELYDFRRSLNQQSHPLNNLSERLIPLLAGLIDDLLINPRLRKSG